MAGTFLGMVVLWGSAATLGIDPTAVAFLGLGVLLATRVLTLADIAKEGDVLATFIWFASLFAMRDQLNQLGFMEFLGQRLVLRLGGLTPVLGGVALVVVYVLLHYLFVSQTAHLLALFGVFLGVGVKLGVPAAPLAFQLLFATNYFAVITPQGSSANLLFAGSGFLSQGVNKDHATVCHAMKTIKGDYSYNAVRRNKIRYFIADLDPTKQELLLDFFNERNPDILANYSVDVDRVTAPAEPKA